MVGLYSSIPHKTVLETLRKRLNEGKTSEIPAEDIVRMAEFALKYIFFEFNGEFTPPYACIFMDEVETEFLKIQ